MMTKGSHEEFERQRSLLEGQYPHTPGFSADDTSRKAASDIAPRTKTIRHQVLNVIKHEPATVHEASERLDLAIATIQPRFSELRRMGLIEDGGDRRYNEATGKKAIVWQPVADINAGLPKAYLKMIAREQELKDKRRGI